MTVGDWIFVPLALLLVRPVALNIALLGSQLDLRERITAAWFGPKGFASVVYALSQRSQGRVRNAEPEIHFLRHPRIEDVLRTLPEESGPTPSRSAAIGTAPCTRR
ncbi:MAG: hypothetical protein ACYC6N_02095 [Pirellulaceae bacterium]